MSNQFEPYHANETFFEPFISVKPRYSTVYWKREYFGSSYCSDDETEQPESTKTNGLLSEKAMSRLNTAINWMAELAPEKKFTHPTKLNKNGKPSIVKYKIGLITLSLPAKQMHTDTEIVENCLQPFLKKLRNRYGEKIKADTKTGYRIELNFVWKAEKQWNGNLHFHIVIDKFIWHTDLRQMWNEVLAKQGYIEKYRENMKSFFADGFKVRPELLIERENEKHNTKKIWTVEEQKQAYDLGVACDWTNPNSVDIHSVQKIRKLAAYLSTYMAKDGLSDDERDKYKELIQKKLDIQNTYDFQILIEHQNMIKNGYFFDMPERFKTAAGFKIDQYSYLEYINTELAEYNKKVSDIEMEMEKYSNKLVTCKLWDCSQSLEKIKIVFDVELAELSTELQKVVERPEYIVKKERMDARAAEQGKEKNDNFLIIPFTVPELKTLGASKIAKLYDEHIEQLKKEKIENRLTGREVVGLFSYLDQSGAFSKKLAKPSTDEKTNLLFNRYASWAAECRKKNNALTDENEKEIFEFLCPENKPGKHKKKDFINWIEKKYKITSLKTVQPDSKIITINDSQYLFLSDVAA